MRGVASQVAKQLADPRPADRTTLHRLHHYKGLDRRWQDWDVVREICREVARDMVLR